MKKMKKMTAIATAGCGCQSFARSLRKGGIPQTASWHSAYRPGLDLAMIRISLYLCCGYLCCGSRAGVHGILQFVWNDCRAFIYTGYFGRNWPGKNCDHWAVT